MSGLQRDYGEEPVVDLVVLLLIKLASYFQVSNLSSPETLRFAAELIVREYYWYGIADFKVFTEMAVSGKLGPDYNRIDPPTIFRMLSVYDNLRTLTAEHESITEATSLSFGSSSRISESQEIAQIIETIKPK